MRHTRTTLIAILLLAASTGTQAYNSGKEENPGPRNVREESATAALDGWMMHSSFSSPAGNEHGWLFLTAMDLAGLPSALSDPNSTLVYVDQSLRTVRSLSSLAPAELGGAFTVPTPRTYTIPALAGLPDHSFSLWDWVNGNESCPDATEGPGASTPPSVELCHNVDGHLGFLNSTHFGTQAASTYAHYHALALTRARQCEELSTRFESSDLESSAPTYVDRFLLECEREALSIEAFGQHFLQDLWASGHMWERWGQPSLARFPNRLSQALGPSSTFDVDRYEVAELVGLTAGIFHGVGNVLPRAPFERDLLSGGAQVRSNDGTTFFAIGDRFASDIVPTPTQTGAAQYRGLIDCSAAGILEVYNATGTRHGDAMDGGSLPSPTGPACVGQRATNASMLAAAAAGPFALKNPYLLQQFVLCPLAVQCLPGGALRDRWIFDVNKIVDELEDLAETEPGGIAAARLEGPELERLLDVWRNSLEPAPAPFVDPQFPDDDVKSWPAVSSDSEESTNAGRSLARFFNRAHLADWCDAAEPESLVTTLADRVHTAPAANRPAACQICMEFAARHVVGPAGELSACAVANNGDSAPIFADPALRDLSLADVLEVTAANECGCGGIRVIAETNGAANGPNAQPFSGFDKVSINNRGEVAFVGSNAVSQVFATNSLGALHPVSQPGSTNRLYGGAAINDSSFPEVASQDRAAGSPPSFFIRKWDANSFSVETALVGRSSGSIGGICQGGSRAGQSCTIIGGASPECPSIVIPNTPQTFLPCVGAQAADFDSATSFVDINDHGVVAFPGLVGGSVRTALFAGSSRSNLEILWETTTSPTIRPQISNTNDVVYRDNLNRVVVRRYPDATLGIVTEAGLENVGTAPGISADGHFVAYTASGASGPGIYLAQRGFVERTLPMILSSSGDPNTPEGRFTSFNTTTRVAVSSTLRAQSNFDIVVLFVATRTFRRLPTDPQTVAEGLFRVTARLTNDGQLNVNRPRLIAQVGDPLSSEDPRIVTGGFGLWDPLSSSGGVMGFAVNLTDGFSVTRAIVRAR